MKIFKLIDDMSNVRRWSHAYCHKEESVLEHTAVVSLIALSIGVETGAKMATVLERALLHDMEEVITGDIPNPTKYHNPRITAEIKEFENIAAQEIAETYFKDWAYRVWADAKDDSLEGEIMQISDIGAVVLKIRQERALGNESFDQFENNVWNSLNRIKANLRHPILNSYINEMMNALTGENDENT